MYVSLCIRNSGHQIVEIALIWFSFKKCIWKRRLPKWRPICTEANELYILLIIDICQCSLAAITPIKHKYHSTNPTDVDSKAKIYPVGKLTTRTQFMWYSDAIWCHMFWSLRVQVMACCLTAPNHYLSQWWLKKSSCRRGLNLSNLESRYNKFLSRKCI